MERCNFIILTTLLLLNTFISSAQEEKKSIKLGLNYLQINDQSYEVSATAKSKRGKKFEAVGDVEVEFFLGEQTPGNSLGKAKTNRKGIASIELPDAIILKLDSVSPFKLAAFVAEGKDYNEQSTEIEIAKARIDLSISEVDSTRKISAKLRALKEGKWIEVPETEMKIFVRRIFSDLSLSENALTTNETGDVSVDLNFKATIPGDAKGNIIIGAKVEDNESYGTIIALKYAKWGVPQKVDRSFYERSLWAARDKTPIWLLVFPNLVIFTVWGLIFYLFSLIFRIRKVGLEQ
ncbi:MAG: hypothetical protein HYR67_01090 [Bacteroidetes bacterium]|nr:hypothetical protein [Bacteroidota bacterium]